MTTTLLLKLTLVSTLFLKKEEKPATKPTTPVASPTDSEPQTRQDRSSESTTSTSPVTTETKAEEPIEDNYFRIHVKKLPEENKDAQGLWTWDDVEKPSENWPNGALSFVSFCSEDLGAFYLDILKDRLYTTKADNPAYKSA